MRNKYYDLLEAIITDGQVQENKKGPIHFLTNQVLSLNTKELDHLFKTHKVARKKLADELELYMNGVDQVAAYQAKNIFWWNYCAPKMINTYPKYFAKLPALIYKINKEKRPSKNYMLFIGETGVVTSQLPCLSTIQFQIINGKLQITVFQRSADSNLGLPSDIYQMYLIAGMIDVPLDSITFFIGNAHIYDNNVLETLKELQGEDYKYNLNV